MKGSLAAILNDELDDLVLLARTASTYNRGVVVDDLRDDVDDALWIRGDDHVNNTLQIDPYWRHRDAGAVSRHADDPGRGWP